MSHETLQYPARRNGRFCVALLATLASTCLLAGCGGGKPIDMKDGQFADTAPARSNPTYDDTVGYYADLPANERTLVRGYGLVLLPGETGSRECPPVIRKVIYDQLNRMRVGETTSILGGVKLEDWIDSPQTAAVEVRGYLPSGALKGQTFDVLVTALPGTQTTSLEGGTLVLTDLSIWRRGMGGGLIHGKRLAVASGSIFINPFGDVAPELDTVDAARLGPVDRDRPAGTPIDPRRGRVLGGAEVVSDQQLFLVLREPNYQIADMTQRQLNTRFPSPYLHGVAHSSRPGTVELRVPPEFRDQVPYWLALVQQVYLQRNPQQLEKRVADLRREMVRPGSDKARVALSLVAMGKQNVSFVRPLYDHEDPSVSFHACYAGLKMGDGLALRKLLYEIARDPNHPHRIAAILALGEKHRFRNIAPAMLKLLDEDNALVRTAAYQSMDNLGSGLISREQIGMGKLGFRMDVVHSSGPYLIFVTRVGEPRIVLFGGEMNLMRPTFLQSDRTGMTVNVGPASGGAEVLRRDPRSGQLMVWKFEEKPVADPKTGELEYDVDPITGEKKVRTEILRVTRFPLTRTEVRRDPVTGNMVAIEVPSLRVADLIRLIGSPPRRNEDGIQTGLGLSYGQVVHVLHNLSRNTSIAANIFLQPLTGPNVTLDELPDEPLPRDIREVDETTPSRPRPAAGPAGDTPPVEWQEPSDPPTAPAPGPAPEAEPAAPRPQPEPEEKKDEEEDSDVRIDKPAGPPKIGG